MVRPSWLTSSGTEGRSASWQTTAKDAVPAGAPDQARGGLRFPPMVTWPSSAGTQKAKRPGIAAPSSRASMVTSSVAGMIRSFPNPARAATPSPRDPKPWRERG